MDGLRDKFNSLSLFFASNAPNHLRFEAVAPQNFARNYELVFNSFSVLIIK